MRIKAMRKIFTYIYIYIYIYVNISGFLFLQMTIFQ